MLTAVLLIVADLAIGAAALKMAKASRESALAARETTLAIREVLNNHDRRITALEVKAAA